MPPTTPLPMPQTVIPGNHVVGETVSYGRSGPRETPLAEDSFMDLVLTPGAPHLILLALALVGLWWLDRRNRRRDGAG